MVAGVFLLFLVLALGNVVAVIPMAALVAVMIVVAVATFDWHSISLSTITTMPKTEIFVMVVTVVTTVWTHNLAIGVGVGVVVEMVMFARRVAHFMSVSREVITGTDTPTVRYTVVGELFFASSNDLTTQFEYSKDPELVIIDMSQSHIWDASTVVALDAIETKYGKYGKNVVLEGMNEATTALHTRLTGELNPDT